MRPDKNTALTEVSGKETERPWKSALKKALQEGFDCEYCNGMMTFYYDASDMSEHDIEQEFRRIRTWCIANYNYSYSIKPVSAKKTQIAVLKSIEDC